MQIPMARWRPPAKPSSPYITAPGAVALKNELKTLWSRERPEVVKALAAAAAEGDRSENAEYIYRKKQLAGIDRRIRYLSKRLDVVKVVDQAPADRSKIRFGAWVGLCSDGGTGYEYRIVGADETDAELGWISVDSPVARCLLGKSTGETVTVSLPQGDRLLEILRVDYGRDDPRNASEN